MGNKQRTIDNDERMNQDRNIYIPPGGPPRIPGPSHDIYPAMGEANIMQMLVDVYERLGQSKIAYMFPKEHDELMFAAKKSGLFFVGLMGGPPLYHQQIGPPMLRGRHLPFVIDEAGRLEWLRCFDEVLDTAVEELNFPTEHLEQFRAFLHGFSTWMVNRAE